MPKNIVICCDGTGNEIKEDLSNVLKLYQLSMRSSDQVCFYDPGVGTIGRLNNWAKFRDKFREILTGATGYGLDNNVIDAYSFLVRTYEEGDKIFLFGFSRGAYTARVLAGFIRSIGILHPEQLNLATYAQKWYKQVADTGDFSNLGRFAEVTHSRQATIHFLGLWDTVSSLFRPNGKLLSLGLTKKKYPFTVNNDAVRIVRHAVAIDELRATFKADLWGDKQEFKSHWFDRTPEKQDVKEVWFAGVHSDVGGGYPESESGLAKIALKWMVVEAVSAGLQINEKRYHRIVLGNASKRSKRTYVCPDFNASPHNSYRGHWLVLGKHTRVVPAQATLHGSVRQRMDSDEACYAPKNLDAENCTWEMDRDLSAPS